MKANKKVTAETAVQMNESKNSKGFKPSKSENTMLVISSRTETKKTFVSYIVSKEEISISKFFRLFASFKSDNENQYKEFISAYKLNLNETYDFSWFISNCPKDENGNFAQWKKVSEKYPKSEKAEFNRKTAKGVEYTLVAYNTMKADYTQFISVFMNVVNEIKRIQSEKAAAEKAAKKAAAEKAAAEKENERNLKAVNEIFSEIQKISNNFSVPFETAVSIYENVKKANYSKELKSLLLAKAAETK